ncbi:hypothetical protein [Devosia lacusdianchii]|uniref:hypothetical protein n=1 Tax=Devosia lacusdianchii TaxID=2917991 RepID=UPI001F05ACA0|nr:hypothetical protein [Devosia sp. JXJ CY 41]
MIVPPYIARALKGWHDWREARQRQKRREMMLRASPTLRAAAELHDKHLRQHRPTRSDMAMMRDATADMLRRSKAR